MPRRRTNHLARAEIRREYPFFHLEPPPNTGTKRQVYLPEREHQAQRPQRHRREDDAERGPH